MHSPIEKAPVWEHDLYLGQNRQAVFNIFFSKPLKWSSGSTTLKNLEAKLLAAAAAKSLQSCLTRCNPLDGSSPGSPIPGMLQARTLEWVAISFSNAWKWKVKVKSLSRVWLLVTHGLQPTRLLRPWDFPGKSTGVGCHCLLQRWMLLLILFL